MPGFASVFTSPMDGLLSGGLAGPFGVSADQPGTDGFAPELVCFQRLRLVRQAGCGSVSASIEGRE